MARFINRDNLTKQEVKRIYGRTQKGLIAHIYQAQKDTSKRRGYDLPSYSKEELSKWVYSQTHFHELYNRWKESDYNKELRPSIDRLNDYESYSISNIQLITLEENNKKSKQKQCKGVVQMTRFSNKIINSFPSASEACKQTGVDSSCIRKVVRGERDQAGGYYWTSSREDS